MNSDPTPGVAKAVTGTTAALLGGALAKVALKILSHQFPWLVDETTSDAIDVIAVAAVVGISTYAVPHKLGPSA